MSLRLTSLALAAALAAGIALPSFATAQPDQADAGVELWGEPGDDPEARGAGKATGSSYNYTHIAYAAGVMAVIAALLIWLIRRQTRDRQE